MKYFVFKNAKLITDLANHIVLDIFLHYNNAKSSETTQESASNVFDSELSRQKTL